MAAVDTFLVIDPMDLSYTCIKKDSMKDEVAVITGSTSNIGLGYARAIAWAGGKVVVTGRNEKLGAEVQRVIDAENAPGTALFVRCDVTQEDSVKTLAEKALDKFGRVDILINNAMNLELNGPVLKSPVSDLDESYAIAARGTMLTIKEFVPGMIERKHGIVVYSSTQFHYSPPMIGGAIYTAGKAAATSLTMSLANEVGPYEESGVSVFCMLPPGVRNSATPRTPVSPDGRDLSKRPLKRNSTTGFSGQIPPEANAAGMVFCLMNTAKLHRSGVAVTDAFHAMDYPFPLPEHAHKSDMRRLTDLELTLIFKNMGHGFGA